MDSAATFAAPVAPHTCPYARIASASCAPLFRLPEAFSLATVIQIFAVTLSSS